MKNQNTSLCYIKCKGKVLLIHRTKKANDENEGKWIGIGGHFEKGESPEECMVREVFEETSIKLSSWQYRGIVTFASDIYDTEYMHLFTADLGDAEPDSYTLPDCPEGELCWIPEAEMPFLSQWEGDKVFLRLLALNEPFFSLKLLYEGYRLSGAYLNGKKFI